MNERCQELQGLHFRRNLLERIFGDAKIFNHYLYRNEFQVITRQRTASSCQHEKTNDRSARLTCTTKRCEWGSPSRSAKGNDRNFFPRKTLQALALDVQVFEIGVTKRSEAEFCHINGWFFHKIFEIGVTKRSEAEFCHII